MARANSHSFWQDRPSPSLDEIEALAGDAFGTLPDAFRKLCGEIVIRVADFPDEDVLDEMGLESPYDLLGLFQGTGLAHRGHVQTGELPNMIWLYRRPLLDFWAESDDTLGHLVAHVLIHEIGHHFGMSDDDMEAIEAEARD
ncbi:metallopeptidase family protein [Microbaculum marinum]|uniref:Metallopeptidase family protein n=1 Tax=Microbaculum marinum TaxID=1764581 RepID=A0AAW9S2Z5_9HYPH